MSGQECSQLSTVQQQPSVDVLDLAWQQANSVDLEQLSPTVIQPDLNMTQYINFIPQVKQERYTPGYETVTTSAVPERYTAGYETVTTSAVPERYTPGYETVTTSAVPEQYTPGYETVTTSAVSEQYTPGYETVTTSTILEQHSPVSETSTDLCEPVLLPKTSPESGFHSSSDDGSQSESPVSEDELEKSLTDLLHHISPQPLYKTNNKSAKPATTYLELIGRAILSVPRRKMILVHIYDYILEHYTYYRTAKSTWKNAVRHNLSTHECFIKNGRAENGRGYFWSIHPANIKAFTMGDFRRREAMRRVQEVNNMCHQSECKMSASTYQQSSVPSNYTTGHAMASGTSSRTIYPHTPQQASGYHQGAPHYYMPMGHYYGYMYGY